MDEMTNEKAEYFAKTPVDAYSFNILEAHEAAIKSKAYYERLTRHGVAIDPVEMIVNIQALWDEIRVIMFQKRPEDFKEIEELLSSGEVKNIKKAFWAMQLFIYKIGVTRIDNLPLAADPTNPFSVDAALKK